MYGKLIIFSIIFLWPASSFGQFDEFVTSYFDGLEQTKASVFYSHCGSRTDGEYLATLILEVGTEKGLLIEMNRRVVLNLASVVITASGISMEETHGGVYTMERVQKLIDELSREAFRLITPFIRTKLDGVAAASPCSNTP